MSSAVGRPATNAAFFANYDPAKMGRKHVQEKPTYSSTDFLKDPTIDSRPAERGLVSSTSEMGSVVETILSGNRMYVLRRNRSKTSRHRRETYGCGGSKNRADDAFALCFSSASTQGPLSLRILKPSGRLEQVAKGR